MTTATASTAAQYSEREITVAVARGLATARDRPQPEEDALCSPQKYARMAQNFRRGAWKHLDENDLVQASNKAWGLVAETIKAISAYHGGYIHTHRSIWMVARELRRLAEASGDLATRRLISNSFMIARSLHSNFYEDKADAVEVTDGLRQCEELSELLYLLFWPEGAAFDGNI